MKIVLQNNKTRFNRIGSRSCLFLFNLIGIPFKWETQKMTGSQRKTRGEKYYLFFSCYATSFLEVDYITNWDWSLKLTISNQQISLLSDPKIFQNYPFPARLSKTLNARNGINLINVFAFPRSNRIEGKTWTKVSKFATRHICAILGRRIS